MKKGEKRQTEGPDPGWRSGGDWTSEVRKSFLVKATPGHTGHTDLGDNSARGTERGGCGVGVVETEEESPRGG